MKGLSCEILGTDCTNRGITSGARGAILCGDGICEIFEPSDDRPALALCYEFEPRGCRAGQLTLAKPRWLEELGRLPDPLKDWNALNGRDRELKCYSQQHEMVRVVARPIVDGEVRTGGMFGGHYIESCDARFPTTAPIPVHDRFE